MSDFEQEIPIIELEDENGETVSFEHLMTLTYKENDYLILTPLTEDTEEEDDEQLITILQVLTDEEGNDEYCEIEDETLLNEVFEAFVEIVESEEDEEYDELPEEE